MKDEEKVLFIKAQNGDEKAFTALVKKHRYLVYKIVGDFNTEYEDIEDIKQSGFLGLVLAIKRFDINKGTKFSTYAYRTIKGTIMVYLRDNNLIHAKKTDYYNAIKINKYELSEEPLEVIMDKLSLTKQEASDALELALNNIKHVNSLNVRVRSGSEDREGTYLDALVDKYFDNVEYISLKDVFNTLSDMHKDILYYRYYLGYNGRETADILNMPKSTLAHRENKALEKLRLYLLGDE